MSRSVSPPSSVTNTSPCWNGLIVPGSTFRYGSNFWTCTFNPRALRSRPSEAAVMPFPSDETTPPVTNTYLGGWGLMRAALEGPRARPAFHSPAEGLDPGDDSRTASLAAPSDLH